ncbi:MAG: DUF1800 domain-containing protein [Phycisphaeraceae bacterium]|nr:DUF1800 domain-containing protein [Phycisphaeraceae bacterium]
MPEPSLKPLRPDRFGFAEAQHLLQRAGFGGTPQQIQALAELGLDRAVEFIVDYQRIGREPVPADAFDRDIMRPADAEERTELRQARARGDEAVLEAFRMERQRRQQLDRQQFAALQRWWMKRIIETPAPLEEKMTLFWHGHFATAYRPIEDSYHLFMQNRLFREHAVGSFRSLVHGIIRDPAMLAYLNNNQNNRRRPNENLARELMELFTLGEGNVYTEQDIREAARALTGYTFDDDDFIFREGQHDSGEKTLFGRRGQWNGADLVELILSNAVVAEFICSKLYRYFVSDAAEGWSRDARSFVQRLAGRFRDAKFEIAPVLKAIFRSEHFYDGVNRAAQIKSPVQLAVQLVRQLHTPVRSLDTLVQACAMMGQDLFQPPSVKGWDGGRAWINTSTLFVRQNLAVYLLTGRRPGGTAWERDGAEFDAMPLLDPVLRGTAGSGTQDVCAYLLRTLLGRPPADPRLRQVEAFVDACGGRFDNQVLIGVLTLITALPEYQLC